jgi:hypothetical protein
MRIEYMPPALLLKLKMRRLKPKPTPTQLMPTALQRVNDVQEPCLLNASIMVPAAYDARHSRTDF